MGVEGQLKEAAGYVKEELNEHDNSPEGQRKAQEGRDLRNEGRVEDGKAPKTSKPGINWPKSGQVVINIPVTNAVKVQPGTNSFVVDFDLAKSFEIPQGKISTLGASWRGWAAGVIDNSTLPQTGSLSGTVKRDSIGGAVGALVQVELMKNGSVVSPCFAVSLTTWFMIGP